MRRMASGALDGLLVLDLAGNVSGAFAGKILCDLGARVVMIEPEAGSPARRLGVFDYVPSGPHAEWTSSDLVTWGMGGYHSFPGSPDREPIWLPGPHAQLHAAAHAAFAGLVGLHERERSGRGQAVE